MMLGAVPPSHLRFDLGLRSKGRFSRGVACNQTIDIRESDPASPRVRNIHTVTSGAIHWKVSRLKKPALYSRDGSLVSGTGGLLPHFSGFILLYHFFLPLAELFVSDS